MIFLKKYTFFFILLLIITPSVKAQNNRVDSLSRLSFEVLEKHFKEQSSDSIKKQSAQAFLLKAKREKKSIKIADGYYFLSELNKHNTLGVKYADSIILTSRSLNHKEYPAKGYIIKGNVFYEFGKYKEALIQYLTALEFAKKNKNEFQEFVINFNIGLLKNILGERDEAQVIFEYSADLIEKNKEDEQYFNIYHRILYALADSYVYSNKHELASETTKKGILLSLKFEDNETYSYLVLNSGINNFFNKQYSIACDSLKKSKEILLRLNDQETRVALCNYYIGRSLTSLKRVKEGIQHFKAADSIIQQTNDITPELIEVYNYLIEDAQKRKDLKSELNYTKSLIKYDSILNVNYKYLKKNITKKYETPKLINGRDKLISQLNKREKKLNSRLLILTIIALIFLIILIYFIKRNFNNKKRYNQLVNEIKKKSAKTDTEISELIEGTTIGIPEHIVKDILVKLEIFESSNQFTKKKYTLNSLAKEINTNSSYLSKVINVTKSESFAHYLNNLKIDFAVDKLSKDKKFKSFTIKAIAEDSGFNTAQSFTNAFYKKTGIYPSYFIKKLENK
jgi:AraC-like DNA-binding protein